jgi:hypothetical protein
VQACPNGPKATRTPYPGYRAVRRVGDQGEGHGARLWQQAEVQISEMFKAMGELVYVDAENVKKSNRVL